MASRSLWIIIAILLAAGLLGLYYSYQNSAPSSPLGETSRQSNGGGGMPAVEPVFRALVSATDDGFSPAEVTIKKGETVRFVNNQSAAALWVASALHPTHTVYPNSGIAKCGTPAQEGIFDTCRGLKAGEFWEFTFENTGSWGYHNHLNTRHVGKIIVE